VSLLHISRILNGACKKREQWQKVRHPERKRGNRPLWSGWAFRGKFLKNRTPTKHGKEESIPPKLSLSGGNGPYGNAKSHKMPLSVVWARTRSQSRQVLAKLVIDDSESTDLKLSVRGIGGVTYNDTGVMSARLKKINATSWNKVTELRVTEELQPALNEGGEKREKIRIIPHVKTHQVKRV